MIRRCNRSLTIDYVTDCSLYGLSPFGYSMCSVREECTMLIRNPTDLGAFIRDRRSQLGLDQAELAERSGTSRKWLIEVEQGKPRAEIGLILRTLKALEVSLD